MQRLPDLTDEMFQTAPGSLSPGPQRNEENGRASGAWGISENNRRAKYYALTGAGLRQLVREQAHCHAIAMAVARVLERA